jgi:formamidopyrimidine-DNA glycosylase
MPELPEVETIRRQLSRKIVGKELDGKKILKLRRRAKILIIDFTDGSSLIFHLKMTGQLIFNGTPSAHTRQVFCFKDGSKLIFNDARKFGWWKKVGSTLPIEKKFGPEALKVGLKEFESGLRRHPLSKIKALLMNQEFIAGIGNIYSDEILFASKIHPLRQARTLKPQEVKSIHRNISKILTEAIRHHGSSVASYVDACGRKGDYVECHKVYQREGEKCFRCGDLVKRIKMGGRSAHFCPSCQKL